MNQTDSKFDVESIASDVIQKLKLAAAGHATSSHILDGLCQRITETWFTPAQAVALWCYIELARGLNAQCRPAAAQIADCIGLKVEEIVHASRWCQQIRGSVESLSVPQLLDSPPPALTNQLTLFIARLCKTRPAPTKLKGLQPREFQRADESSWLLNLISGIPGYESQLSGLVSSVDQAYVSAGRVMLRSSAIDAKLAKIPDVQSALERACEALDYRQEPEVYVMNGARRIKMVGIRRPAIIVPCFVASTHDVDELTFLIARELGKLICDQQRILAVLDGTFAGVAAVDFGLFATAGISMTVKKWRRAAGLTCDRAGLLACQSIEVANRVLLKEMGYPQRTAGTMPAWILEELIAEREQLQNSGRMDGILDKGLNWTFNTFRSELPPLERAYHLHRWVSEGGYGRVMRREGAIVTTGAFLDKPKVDPSKERLAARLFGKLN